MIFAINFRKAISFTLQNINLDLKYYLHIMHKGIRRSDSIQGSDYIAIFSFFNFWFPVSENNIEKPKMCNKWRINISVQLKF